MRDKIAGVIYGMALGDAMGMPAELWGRNRAKKFFGGTITEFLDGPQENDVAMYYKKGQFTDDTGQALVLLDSISSTSYVPDVKDISNRLLLRLSSILYFESRFNFLFFNHLVICQSPLIHLESLVIKLLYLFG